MAVLDKTGKRLYWFTCYGAVYDSVQLHEAEYAQIASNIVDPFNFYKALCQENEAYFDDATGEFRRLGKLALNDTSYTRRMIYNSTPVKSAHSTLLQLMAIEGLFKKQCLKLCLFNRPSPSASKGDGFLLRKSLAGKSVNKPDTTIYYATSPLGFIAKISLRSQDSLKAFVYDGHDHVVDSMPLKPGKYAYLLKSRDDVFLLYRGWLELQSQQVSEAMRQTIALLDRQDTGLYIQAYRVENRKQLLIALTQFKNQQQDIERKILSLRLPDEEMVDQMLRSNYPSDATEISYLSGGMGFAYVTGYKRGGKTYELTNHLGNVVATVSDKKMSVDDGDGTVAYYNADAVNSSDYYPFGSLMPGRSYDSDKAYRYGFNGKENDNEVKGEGDQQDYGMRVYDPRLGRFLSIDPLHSKYPELTPFQFASNSPVQGIDLDGEELVNSNNSTQFARLNNGVLVLPVVGAKVIERGAIELSTRLSMNAAGELIESSSSLGPIAGGATLFVWLMLQPANDDDKGSSASTPDKMEIFTDDPSTLTDYYLNTVKSRILDGTAKPSDWKYKEEAEKRGILPEVNMKPGQYSTARSILARALKRQGLPKLPGNFKEKWAENGYDYEVRSRGADNKAPAGSNSAHGQTFRVARRLQGKNENGQGNGWEYADDNNNWYSETQLKSGNNPQAANDTHIPVNN
ncbi:RHS repeat-associated core domain-containing protein [Chitinophaga parva]|nr:RHS repeat-associated core domain-containing protein [Chitinophaga parva]